MLVEPWSRRPRQTTPLTGPDVRTRSQDATQDLSLLPALGSGSRHPLGQRHLHPVPGDERDGDLRAHPALYLGDQSDFAHPRLNLGVSSPDAIAVSRPFPAWLTGGLELPNGRRWHFFLIWIFILNGLVYVVSGLLDRHIWRDLLPTGWQLREIGTTIRHHLSLYFPHQRDYNVLQKFVYLGLIFIVFPGIILTGLAMSPGMEAIVPGYAGIFGGRQSARTIHFVCASLIVLFVIVHVGLVLASGFWNNLISMITGDYEVEPEEEAATDGP